MTLFLEKIARTNPSVKMLWGFLRWPLVCESWYLGILACLDLWKDREVKYRFRDGTRVLANLGSTEFQILREAFIYDTYGFKDVDFKKVKYLLDGGAHIGFPSINIARKHPTVRIFCVEPCELNEKKLKVNIKMNHVDNIKTLHWAMSDRDGVRNLYVTKFSALHSLTNEKIETLSKNVERVKCYSLQSIMKQEKIPRIDLLKLDVEGEEYDILYHLPRRLLSQIRYLLVEAHPVKGHSIGELEGFFKARGFVTHRPYLFENVVFAERRAGR